VFVDLIVLANKKMQHKSLKTNENTWTKKKTKIRKPKRKHKLKSKTKGRNNNKNGKLDVSYEIEFQWLITSIMCSCQTRASSICVIPTLFYSF
jgi:hypothetical protein